MLATWDSGENVVETILSKPSFTERAQIVVDIFYNKSPATLLKRCNSLGRLCNAMSRDSQVFPCRSLFVRFSQH